MFNYEERKKISKDKNVFAKLIEEYPSKYKKILAYLYMGEELKVNNHVLFMDGETNLFIKGTKEVKGEFIENILLCVNNEFEYYIKKAHEIYKDDKDKMFLASATLVLYNI